jgi:hypothetical protein
MVVELMPEPDLVASLDGCSWRRQSESKYILSPVDTSRRMNASFTMVKGRELKKKREQKVPLSEKRRPACESAGGFASRAERWGRQRVAHSQALGGPMRMATTDASEIP